MPQTSDLTQPFSDRYSLKSLIGHGGMGEVYIARDGELCRDVALKLIHQDASANPEMRQCFNREARAISLMLHPHVVEIYDFGATPAGQIYLSTELVHGDSLHGLHASHLPLKAELDLIIQLLEALEHAHARGLIHRDIKAENVLVTMRHERLWVKLTDFGLASLPTNVEMNSPLANETNFGMPGYMAPEQILHGSRYVGPCTDIYAVGVLLYESLSGHLPFEGSCALEIMRAHLNAPVPDISWRADFGEIPVDVRNDIRDIVHIALRKSPWKRFLTAREFAESLQSVASRVMPRSLPDDDRIRKIRENAKKQPSAIEAKLLENSDIGVKIRAFEAAEDSGLSTPPVSAPNRDVWPDSADFDVLTLADLEAMGNSGLHHSGVFRMKNQAFMAQIQSIAALMGAEFEFYKEILYRTAVLGPEFYLKEVEVFWRLDEDRALADCWREALAAWAGHGILEFRKDAQIMRVSGVFAKPSQSSNHQSIVIAFVEPDHADICTASLPARKMRMLKAQAALALTEVHVSPSAQDTWRIACLWRVANDQASFIQSCDQSAQLALSDFNQVDTKFAYERYEELGLIYDDMMMDPTAAKTHPLLRVIEWPQMLINGAQNSLMLDHYHAFERHQNRIKCWVDTFAKPLYLAHIQRLKALYHLRRDNYLRASELSSLSCESFSICNDEIEAARSNLVMADAELHLSNPRNARQILLHAQDVFTQHGLKHDIARIQARIAILDWFAGSPITARENASQALAVFQKLRQPIQAAHCKLHLDFMHYFDEPGDVSASQIYADAENILSMGDSRLLAHARVRQIVILALENHWEAIHDIAADFKKSSQKSKFSPSLHGTLTCLHAIELAFERKIDLANAEMTTAIACFGPHNKRARAWCHALMGAMACFTRQIRTGVQSFERARNDFLSLNDLFGLATVLVAQSTLALICEEYDDAWAMALDGLEIAENASFPIHASLAVAICVSAAIASGHPEKSCLAKSELPLAVPRIFQDAFKNALNHDIRLLQNMTACTDIIQRIQACLDSSSDSFANIQFQLKPSIELNIAQLFLQHS